MKNDLKNLSYFVLTLYILANTLVFTFTILGGFVNPYCGQQTRTRLFRIVFPIENMGCKIGNWLGETN